MKPLGQLNETIVAMRRAEARFRVGLEAVWEAGIQSDRAAYERAVLDLLDATHDLYTLHQQVSSLARRGRRRGKDEVR